MLVSDAWSVEKNTDSNQKGFIIDFEQDILVVFDEGKIGDDRRIVRPNNKGCIKGKYERWT